MAYHLVSSDCILCLLSVLLQARYVKEELKAELDTFGSWERMSTDFSQLLRASFKEFHHSHRYYKGHGRSYTFWLQETHGADFTIHLERADGGRQDLDYDAAVPLYVNRKYFVEFLHDRVFVKGHSNILEDFLYVTFRSVQFVAMARANAVFDFLISRPLRWLSGKSSHLPNWSPRSMGRALDLVEQLLMRAQHDGKILLDGNLDFSSQLPMSSPHLLSGNATPWNTRLSWQRMAIPSIWSGSLHALRY